MDAIDMPALQAREAYERAKAQRELASVRRRAEASGSGARQIDRSSKLYQAAQEFEAIFLKQMLDAMRRTVDKSGLLEGGMAEDIFEDMLYDEYALKMARTARFGFADQIYLQLVGRSPEAK